MACPSCAEEYDLDERFCPRCGTPLVYAGRHGLQQPITEQHERARKIKPQYAEGALVRAAGASNQAEAEFIQGLLLEEGIPSVVQRRRGFDVPDFLAAGPRDVMVPQSGALAARDVLLEAEVVGDEPVAPFAPSPWRLLAALVIGCAVVAVVAVLVTRAG